MSLITFFVVLSRISFPNKIVKTFVILWEKRLRGHRLRKVLFYQLLIFLVAQLIKNRTDVRLSDSSRGEEPTWGPCTRWDNDATRFEFPQVGVVHYQPIYTRFTCILLCHEDLIQHKLVDLFTSCGALHLEVYSLSVEVLKVLLFQLIEYSLNLLFLVICPYLMVAKMTCGAWRVSINSQHRDICVLNHTWSSEIGTITT